MKKKFVLAYTDAVLKKGSSTWYIEVYHRQKSSPNTLKRQRITFGINRIVNLRDREQRAKAVCSRINWWLEQGYYFQDFDEQEAIERMHEASRVGESRFEEINLIKAVEMVRDIKVAEKKSRASKRSYASHANQFIDYLREKRLEKLMLSDFTARHAIRYKNYIQGELGITNAYTFNNKISHVKGFFNVMIEDEYLEKNPFLKVKKKSITESSKAEFTIQELNVLKEEAKEYNKWMYVATQLAFWGAVRQSELTRLKFSYFQFNPFVIKWPPGTTKNKKSYFSTLPNFLFDDFKDLGVFDYPYYNYVLGNDFEPSEAQIKERKINKRHQTLLRIARRKGLIETRKGLSFCCWRLTAANLMADKLKPKELKDFMKHGSFSTTERYMKRRNVLEPILDMTWDIFT